MRPCSLTITAARSDVPFLGQTVPHLVRSCGDVFAERVLVVDVSPPNATFRSRPGLGTLEQLQTICADLRAAGWVDRVVEVDYSRPVRQKLCRKYFGNYIGYTHDLRGSAIFPFLFSFEIARSDYVLHFDSDMLLHQDTGFDWVGEGIELLRAFPDVMFVGPLSGPPARDGILQQRGVKYEADARGFYRIDAVTTRKFLFDKRKFEKLLPLKNYWVSTRRRIFGWVSGESPMLQLEIVITKQFRAFHCHRVDLASPKAWTLHTPDHGSKFIAALPEVIRKVEIGEFPAVQAGDYDLQLEHWI
jgi:hypothetical protein